MTLCVTASSLTEQRGNPTQPSSINIYLVVAYATLGLDSGGLQQTNSTGSNAMDSLAISSTYAAIFGIIYFAISLRVGNHRRLTRVSFGDGEDANFLKIIRAQQNFAEYVPIALLLGLLVEYQAASTIVVHSVFGLLLAGRMLHYLQLTSVIGPVIFRMLGMILTFSSILTSSVFLLLQAI